MHGESLQLLGLLPTARVMQNRKHWDWDSYTPFLLGAKCLAYRDIA